MSTLCYIIDGLPVRLAFSYVTFARCTAQKWGVEERKWVH